MAKKVIVGLSGGVDSSVSALILQQQGYEVEGLFMFNWAEDESGYCEAAEDFQQARAVAQELGIPLHQADFSAEYRERVFSEFLEEYAAGRTPNPDLLCNREIKFKSFLDYALRLGADHIATGHYAQLQQTGDQTRLLRAVDANKDQTYFLALVDGQALQHCLFPLGSLHKPEVRDIAAKAGLPNYARKDSTGICFIGERPMREFLGQYLKREPGPIYSLDHDGREIGQHEGLIFHTLGQRKGLGLGGISDAQEAPWYVIAKNEDDRSLWVSQNAEHPQLMSRQLILRDVHWVNAAPAPSENYQARIRHRQALQHCQLGQHDDSYQLEFEQPQRAAAPGQYAVLYDGDICLGGGCIAEVIN
ncbi:MAG: tRNA 2-thiouridine(34) synthase MnmA [Nevskiales bacterium]